MSHRFLVLSLLFALLAACGEPTPTTKTSGPVVVASRPIATPTATAVPPTDTAAPPPSNTPTPTPLPPSDTPTAVPSPGETQTLPPSDTPLPPTPTPIPPTATLPPPPTATPLPTAVPVADPTTIRVGLRRIVSGLDTPVGIAHANDGSGRLFIVEKPGRIRIVRGGDLLPEPFLDITDRADAGGSEQGLLGLAFHPNYPRNGFLFVNYTDHRGDTVISRFSVTADPNRADPNSEVVILTLDQPAGNHNGGHLVFGPDGYLYIGTGDGGGAGDQYGNGQNGQTLLGAMLRLDVDSRQPYAIPPDNPFLGNPAIRDEMWAIGLRNPWRYSFDRLTGDLYIADVGQNRYEEIDFQPAGNPGGQNYGWPIMEGSHCYPEDQPCDRTGLTLPVVEYDHSQGCSVTGGYVYRGHEFPILTGIYLFGDYCTGRIWGLAPGTEGTWRVAELGQFGVALSSFGEDETGEVYLLDMGRGEVLQITAELR